MTSQIKEEEKKMKKKFQKSYFDVLGICCTSEVPLIENILKSLDGVREYSVIVPSRTVIVVHDSLIISPSQIAKALNQARLEANVKVTGEANFKNKWPNPFAVVSGILLLLSFLKFVYPPLRWVAVAAVAAGIYPILAKAFASVRRLRVDINILIIITVIATLAMQDYMEAAAVVFLFTIADWLESRASYKASSVMQSLMNLAPQKAIIAETGEEVEVDEVKVNTVLAVKAGETIPIDGTVVDGNCEVDEKTLTGEAFPVPKQRDSTVWAGTINLNGYITVKTTALASDCVVAKMAKLVEEAQSSKTKSQRLIDKCAQYYTPAIIVVSACFAIIPVILKVHNRNHWFHLALVVLVSACPCGLILSTPVATFCALTKAATSGLLIKSADYLDTLSKIKIAAFDKTGTITRGEFIVVDFKSLSKDITLRSLLYWVSSVESKSSHPMAATIVDYAKSVSLEPRPEEVEDYQNFPGEGIYGKIDGKDIYIGNKRIASRAGCSTVPETEVDTKGGKTVGYVYVSERLAGVFNLSDACRSGVSQAMAELKSLGIKTAMLTGDNQEAAMHAQEQLGNVLDVVHGELLPEDKSRIIQEFKKEGPTAMVGDGVNDAPALATADIGISMGISGSALATQTGGIILMSNDIRRIPQAIKLARRAQRKVVENVFISIVLKAGILGLAFAGHPLIWAAVLVDVGTCLLVILNSMLLLREKKKPGIKKCYRASTTLLNGGKVEGGDDDVLDLEAGLLTKSGNGQCNSGCCGDKKNQEKVVMMMRPSSKTSSDHGCCGDKKQGNVKLVGDTWSHHHHNLLLSSCKKSTHVNNGLKMKGSSSCCANKNEKVKVIVAKSCCEKPKQLMESSVHYEEKKHTEEIVLEIELLRKDGETSKSSCCENKPSSKTSSGHSHPAGCCGDKKPGNVKLVGDMASSLSSCKKSTHVNNDLKLKGSSSCCANKNEKVKEVVAKSCCEKPKQKMESSVHCEEKKHTEEIVLIQNGLEIELQRKASCCENKEIVKETGLLLIEEEEGSCKSSCCDGEIQTDEVTVVDCCQNIGTVKQSYHEKTGLKMEAIVCCDPKLVSCGNTEEQSDMEIKIEEEGKSGCCGDEKQTGEITLASEEDSDSSGCSTRCCEDKEDVITQICNEKQGSSCCSNEGVPIQSPTDLVLSDLQVKKDEICETSEGAVKVETCCKVKKDEHCETSEGAIKVDTCCKVKTPEACGSKCREREKRHSGKSCCRSYAKEYCSHSHHHHHHHHHHNHVSA